MPSAPRGFQADVPILVTSRCTMRLDLFEHENIAKKFRQLVERFAALCQVEVFAWVLLRNHLHLLVSQRMHGHDKARRKGVAPFLRNTFSALARYAHGLNSTQGRAMERAYRSDSRTTPEEVLAALGYVLMNPVFHGAAKRPEGYDASSAKVYFFGEPDGAVNAIVGLFAGLEGSATEKGKQIQDLVREWSARFRAGGKGASKVEAARGMIRERIAPLDPKRFCEGVSIDLWVGKEAATRAREEARSWTPVKVEFEPRPAPRLRDVLGFEPRSRRGRPRRWVLEEEQDRIE